MGLVSRVSHIEGKLSLLDDSLDERFGRVYDKLDNLANIYGLIVTQHEKILGDQDGTIKCLVGFKNRLIGAGKLSILVITITLTALGLYLSFVN